MTWHIRIHVFDTKNKEDAEEDAETRNDQIGKGKKHGANKGLRKRSNQTYDDGKTGVQLIHTATSHKGQAAFKHGSAVLCS